jgi:hypothetical protein
MRKTTTKDIKANSTTLTKGLRSTARPKNRPIQADWSRKGLIKDKIPDVLTSHWSTTGEDAKAFNCWSRNMREWHSVSTAYGLQLSLWCVVLENLIVVQSIKKFPTSYVTRKFITMSQVPSIVPILSPMNRLHVLIYYLRSLLILSTHQGVVDLHFINCAMSS